MEEYTITLTLEAPAAIGVSVTYAATFPDGEPLMSSKLLADKVYGSLWVAQQQANNAIGRHRKRLAKYRGEEQRK